MLPQSMVLLKNKLVWIDVFIFVALFVGPWWLAFIAASIAAFSFQWFIELVILGIFLDSLYGAPVAWFNNFPYAMTLITLIIFIAVILIKPFLRFSS